MVVVGRSTLRDTEGNVVLEWERTSLDKQKEEEARRAAFEALAAELPRVPPSQAPRASEALLATVYTLTDCHVGALAWKQEGGDDWDLSIAEETLLGCFRHMIQTS